MKDLKILGGSQAHEAAAEYLRGVALPWILDEHYQPSLFA